MSPDEKVLELRLVNPGWSSCGASRARGYATLEERYLDAGELARALEACASDAACSELIASLNGCFALITRRRGSLLAAVDRLRSIPLFYLADSHRCLVSDSAYRVLEAAQGREPDADAQAEFRLTGYVTGRQTLYPGVGQIEAGEFLRWNSVSPGAPQRHRYYDFRHGDFLPLGTGELISALEAVHTRVFRRLLGACSGRTIVVPLSGGYDSRLIGVSLRDLGMRDVICYSYGVPGNWEARISQELARYLGFRWEFVAYSPERWREWAASARFREYFRWSGNLTSVPHIQDWPAVLELRQSGRVPADGIFVPGHSGDFLAGSHIPKHFVRRPLISRGELLGSIYRAHYSLWDWPEGDQDGLRRRLDAKIDSVAGGLSDCSPEQAADAFERWDLRERQAKFICNAVRVYESFGCEWRLPLFDHELMDFWARIPLERRSERKLYFEFAQTRQRLPVTSANRDHGLPVSLAIRGVQACGLMPLAKRIQRVMRRIRWRQVYEHSALAWYALVDRKWFARTYTGKELLHSYLAVQYGQAVLGGRVGRQGAPGPEAAVPTASGEAWKP